MTDETKREVEYLQTDSLIPYARNARTHSESQIAKIAASITEFGFTNPVLIAADNSIIAGHGRVLGAKKLGLSQVPCIRLSHLSDTQRRAYIIADNALALDATWDTKLLGLELADLKALDVDLTQTGLEREKFNQMVNAALRPDVDPDEAPEPKPEAFSKLGDVWLLGDHRLMCGDSKSADDAASLVRGEQIALAVYDPPYFRIVDEEWDHQFEDLPAFLAWIRDLLDIWHSRLIDRATVAVFCAPDYAWHVEGVTREKYATLNQIAWCKSSVLPHKQSREALRRWFPQSERILICEKSHSPDQLLASFNAKTAHIASRSAYASIIERMMKWRRLSGLSTVEIDAHLGTNGMAGHYFTPSQWALPTREVWEKLRPLFASRGVDIGDWDTQRAEFDTQRREFDAGNDLLTDVWNIPTLLGDERPDHPTPKPVDLIANIVRTCARKDDTVLDVFSGSGTTLIACEQTGRACRAMEIAPQYVDVAVRRWEKFTGKKAKRESDGAEMPA